MEQLNKIEFIFNGDFRGIDYCVEKYNISEYKLGLFKEYFKRNNFFNGDEIGIERLDYDGKKLTVVYFKTNYEVAILVRNFLLKDGEVVLGDCDKRANMGFEVLLKDLKGKVILTCRNKDWYGNDVSDIDHFQLTSSEGIEINDVESKDISVVIKQLIERSLREELGLDIDLTKIKSMRLGYSESENTCLVAEVTVDDIYNLKFNIDDSEDSIGNTDDIKDVIIILPMRKKPTTFSGGRLNFR